MKSNPGGLTPERVRELLSYDPETGVLRWKVSPCWRVSVGGEAGIHDRDGYLVVTVDKKKRKAHRLAWAIHHGVWPEGEIDHRNTVKDDNRIDNLRDVSASINMQNIREALPRSKSGVLGVVAQGSKFKSTITVQGHTKHVGTFGSAEEAHEAYLSVKREFHPGCTL